MQGLKSGRGLTDGTSSRYLRANRSRLVPDLDKVKLHERLEELLVFEILKEGETLYHRFSVRALYKHVLKAITAASSEIGEQTRSPRSGGGGKEESEMEKQDSLMDQLALGSAIVNGASLHGKMAGDIVAPKSPTTPRGAHHRRRSSLAAINEGAGSGGEGLLGAIPLPPLHQDAANIGVGPVEPVTYRERLGGFLHPRDMRKLVTHFSASNEPELIVRRHAMLLNFDPLRAIILRDRLLVLVPDGADSLLVELERRVRGSSSTNGGGNGSEGGMKHSISMENFDNFSSTHNSVVSSAKNANSNTNNNMNSSSADIASTIPSTIMEVNSDDAHHQQQHGDDDTPGMDIDVTINELKTDIDDALIALRTKRMDSGVSDASSTDTNTNLSGDDLIDNEWEELEGRGWIDLPFELQSVDAVLHSVSAILADDVFDLQMGANAIIEELLAPGADFGDHSQEMLRGMKNSVGEMTSRVKGFCRAIDMVLEDYEDMTLMNLSRLLTHPERFIQPVPQAILEEESDEPELILEAHLQRGNTLTNALTLVQGQISTTEDFAVRKSDTIRNRLLYINMLISILSLSVAVASFVGSVFGMNVINHYEDNPHTFQIIVVTTVGGGLLLVVFVFFVVKRLAGLPALF